jgi:hypothetical protein
MCVADEEALSGTFRMLPECFEYWILGFTLVRRDSRPPLARENAQSALLGSGVYDDDAGDRHSCSVLWCECDLHLQGQVPVTAQRGLAFGSQWH